MHAIQESEFDLVIFDCDGVIADSEVLAIRVLIDELTAQGVPIKRDFVLKNLVGKSFPAMVAMVHSAFGVQLPETFEAQYWGTLSRIFERELTMTAGFRTFLDTVTCRRCVATNSSPTRVAKTLEVLGLNHVFGADVFTSSQVKRGKPAPDLFLFAAKHMRAETSRTLVIEDSETGVQAALAAGMTVWRYLGANHFSNETKRKIEATSPVPVIQDWSQLADGALGQKADR